MAPLTLTALPPELLDHITTYLPTAQSVTRLGATSRSLHAFVEKDAWQTFNRTRFPSLHPIAPPSPRDAARSLTTLSKAWARRAFVSRYIEPHGDIRAYPGATPVERWKRPRGQTIGFTPQLDVYETIGQTWQEREEVLAFSAGAEVCVRKKRRRNGSEEVRWMIYRPLSAYEGRDDVTTLHLLRPDGNHESDSQQLVTGTANGDLCILQLPEGAKGDVPITYFVTNGQPVRSSSVFDKAGEHSLLVANMGDSRISVYPVDSTKPKITPLSSLDIRPPQSNGVPARHQRVWSTEFLSPTKIAAGLGPSDEPIQVYNLTPSGFDKSPLRKFSLQNDLERLDPEAAASGPAKKKRSSSVYPIVPLPPSTTAGSSTDGNVFLSGAYDGLIRLHDLRSPRDVEQAYSDPADDGAIYSLLSRGQETLVAGTSRHSLLKIFDMRLGAKCYSYLDAAGGQPGETGTETKDWNLFLRPHNAASTNGRGGNSWARRSQESSVYSLASASPHSPYLYAGVENAVLELAFTGVLDRHPDPVFFQPWQPPKGSHGRVGDDSWRSKEVLDLAMYEQTPNMTLRTQKSMWETWRTRQNESTAHAMLDYSSKLAGLDERWRVGSGGQSWT
ncbi:hypothetical protein LTR36_002508 [Oleoguttula mirabilis]|uniref:F-box domain-containing protein n=1 Tax=Oleoguttula mirabilis TaxID=1507867 RepID=A0AAV9JKE3_9PEZI|nr:hypothetical protein LTR36_002508 [Oleoguttula mirabilis]